MPQDAPEIQGRSRAPGLTPYLFLAVTVVGWAVNWPLLKLALADIGPFTVTALRLFGAGVILLAMLGARGRPILPPRGERLPLGLNGLLQMGLLLGLSVIGLQFMGAGRAAVLVYTMQLWAIPIAFLVTGERASRRQLAGALLGFAGLILFFNPGLLDWRNPLVLAGNGLVLAAAWSWALGAILYRRRSYRADLVVQTGWQLLTSSLLVGLPALLLETGRPIRWTLFLVTFLLYNWGIGMGLAYFCWMRALRDLPATTAGQGVTLAPVIAYLLSAAITGERVTWDALASIALIIGGLALTLAAARR